jgi:hypothetical protein
MRTSRRFVASSKRLGTLLTARPLVAAIALVDGEARATEPLSPTAEKLFSDGLKLAHAGDCQKAREKFTESYAVDPAPGTLINWALCEEKLGRSATALELLKLADQTLPANHPKRNGMAKHIETLAKRAPLLRLRWMSALPAGTTITMDGASIETASFASGVLGDPGAHVIDIQAPGRDDRRYEVTLAEGTTLEMTVQAGPPRGAFTLDKAGSGAAGTAPEAEHASSTTASTLGWALAGGGLAVVGAGVVTGLLAKNKWDQVEGDCNLDTRVCRTDAGVQASSAGGTLAAVSTAAFIAGGASLAVGGYLLLTKKDAPATARLSATAGPVTGIRIAGEF